MAREKYPKREKAGDYANFAARSFVAGISTAVGGPLAGLASSQGLELMNFLLKPSLEKRRTEWFEALDEDLRGLEEKVEGIIEKLSKREDFVSITFHATQIALRTHKTEKIQALRAALINAATNPKIDEDKSMTFLGIVDDLTPSHLAVLQRFRVQGVSFTVPEPQQNDSSVFSMYESNREENMFSQVAGALQNSVLQAGVGYLQVGFLKQILAELFNRGLLEDVEKNTRAYTSTVMGPGGIGRQEKERTLVLSTFGNEFINFITNVQDKSHGKTHRN